jgi:hypothetical protein
MAYSERNGDGFGVHDLEIGVLEASILIHHRDVG